MAFFNPRLLLVLIAAAEFSYGTEITISQGEKIVLRLPGAKCGQYTLLNPFLRPVLVIEKKAPKLLEQYPMRSNITATESGYNLTINKAELQDDGRYKVASSKAECKDIQFYVTVKALSQEYLQHWGEWSRCVKDCDARESRSRSRNCSINGGCKDMGQMSETQACDQADNCAHWSKWSSFGECSAKCGKGFKIRSRICLKDSSSLLQTGDCVGSSMQSHMCYTVCEVVGVWAGWTEWSECPTNCEEKRTRNRTRVCNDPRDTPNCPGNYTEYKDCPPANCTENTTNNGTYSVNPVTGTEVANQTWLSKLNLVVMLVIVGAITLIILIAVFMLIRKRVQVKRINSSRLTRVTDNEVENATIDKRLTQQQGKVGRPDGVNVYSELGSSFCYNDSEFDDTEDEEETTEAGKDTKQPESAIYTNDSKEELQNKVNTKIDDRDIVTNVLSEDVNIYDNNTESLKIVRNQSGDSVYSEPPEEEDPADEIIPDDVFEEPTASNDTDNTESGSPLFKELTGLFSVPSIKKLSSQHGSNKSLEGMYRKVNKNRGKPNKVEINHANDVYYDPPIYSESCDSGQETEDNDEPEVNDNVYENCDVTDGHAEIVPTKSNVLNSTKNANNDTSGLEKRDSVNKNDSIKKKSKDTDSDKIIHWKEKEAMEDAQPPSINDKSEPDVNDDPVYVNNEIAKSVKDYYVTPSYEYKTHTPHIYDVPKSPK